MANKGLVKGIPESKRCFKSSCRSILSGGVADPNDLVDVLVLPEGHSYV